MIGAARAVTIARMDVLTVLPPRRDGERVRFAARLAGADGGACTLWFAVPRAHADAVTRRADPFVLAALWRAMRAGRALHVRGAPASPSLLRNLDELQRVWAEWRPGRVRPVSLSADAEEEGEPPATAIAAFSGGVDSCHTILCHAVAPDPAARPRPLGAALMIHGFDIRHGDAASFAGALARARRTLAGVALPLWSVETNARAGLGADWSDAHGLCLAAALSLFAGAHGAGLISATGTWRDLVLPWGSNPLTDPLLGSRSFEIVHTGVIDYLDKVRALAAWPAALENLRVCFAGEKLDRNCGRCRKCVQVALILEVAEADLDCFDERPSPDLVMRVLREIRDEPNPFSHWTMRMILAGAEARRLDAPWVGWLRSELPRFRVHAAVA